MLTEIPTYIHTHIHTHNFHRYMYLLSRFPAEEAGWFWILSLPPNQNWRFSTQINRFSWAKDLFLVFNCRWIICLISLFQAILYTGALPREKLTIWCSGSFHTVNRKAEVLKFDSQCASDMLYLIEKKDKVLNSWSLSGLIICYIFLKYPFYSSIY